MEEIEYKISFPATNETKSFKINDKNNNFIGSIYISNDGIYITLKDHEITPFNKTRPREIKY
jgi:hypothetical protein